MAKNPTMSKNKGISVEDHRKQEDVVNVVQWEDYDQELTRLVSLSSALNEAKEKKKLLQEKLDVLIKVEAESLNRSNYLDEMREKLESQKLMMGNMSMHAKVVKDNVKKEEEKLGNEIRSLLVAGTTLSLSSKNLQEANRLLAGEGGYVPLRKAQRLLRLRQQHMVAQVSLLYPVKSVMGQVHEQELESFSGSRTSGIAAGSNSVDQGSLTISGLHLTMLPFKKISFFADKKEVQRCATALGYVAHAVSLIASYLEVPLRYPLRLGGSRSFIHDHSPSSEVSSDSASNSLLPSDLKPIEFPLFLDGQETTRAAYAVFLLNKDIEQLLNFIGVKSLGPRHVLANLKELLNTILSPEYVNT